MENKKYFKGLDFLRILACLAVLLYHFNLLKGGFLAVNSFFVLTGYLAIKSAFKKEKFNILSYYKNRLLKIYLPVFLVALITVFVVTLIPDFNWLNLKPETTSVLLGYNNFWQLNANLDYFARHVDSPFMHLWYIGILLQFELIFPFFFLLLKKIGTKIHKSLPIIMTFLLALASLIYFFKTSSNIMIAYYHTFARLFSIFFGVMLGFMHEYYKVFAPLKKQSWLMFSFYTIVLVAMMIFVNADNANYGIWMLTSTVVSLRLITYGLFLEGNPKKITKYLASITYEVYLFQYPVIFLFQDLEMNLILKYFLMTFIIFILAIWLHYALDFRKKQPLKYIFLVFILGLSGVGMYNFIIAEDHTEDMKLLEEQLNQNQEMMQQKQEEYALKRQAEVESWASILEELESSEEALSERVSNLPVIGLGDSVMLGAIKNLYGSFKNGYFDAAVSRTCYVANDILKDLEQKKMLGSPVVFNFGANGDCPDSYKRKILNTLGNRELFWLTVTNDKSVHFNDKLKRLATEYSNIHVIDWETISKGHKEYFVSDGIHLTSTGRAAFVQAIYDAIYNYYLDEYNAKKEAIIREHENLEKNKISFFGNDLILNSFNALSAKYQDAEFVLDKAYTYESLMEALETRIKTNNLTYKVVLAFDRKLSLTLNEYNNLLALLENHEIYLLTLNESYNFENVHFIDFKSILNEHPEYLMADKIHLTVLGNEALVALLNEVIQ